ncbi:hypothetical protein PINS_up010782 [Pythium insidiosum]|nr:hypothetical protein PINS_up010782 [Pythium insidiosum]
MAEKQKYDFAASKLQLWFAKKGDAWLPDDDPAALRLERGESHEDIQAVINGEKLKATWSIQHCLDHNKLPLPMMGQIHVLVLLPPEEVAVPRLSQELGPVVREDIIWHGTTGGIGHT